MNDTKLFRRILVAVDAHGLSNHAVLRGFSLAEHLGSHLDLVHAVEDAQPLWPGGDWIELSRKLSEKLVRIKIALSEKLAPVTRDAGEKFELDERLHVLPGRAARVILEQAIESEAELIILGPHAKHSLFDFGSTARTVLSRTSCPVWLQSNQPEPIKRILVPVDFSEHSQSALKHAHKLASRLGASIQVLHCYSPPVFAYGGMNEIDSGPIYVIEEERKAATDALALLMKDFDWADVAADSKCVDGDVATELVREANSADMIVMGTHGRTGLSRFILGSVAYSVLRQAEVPVLAVPSPERSWQLDEQDETSATAQGGTAQDSAEKAGKAKAAKTKSD